MDIAAALQAAHVSVAEADRAQARRDEQRAGTVATAATAASGLPHYSPHAGAVVVPVVPPAPRSAAAVPAARAPVRRLAPAAASFGSAVPHPLQALVAALPASAARPSLHGPSGGGSGGGAGGALHKCSDPFSLALLLEEARLALQYGKHAQALTIYQLLIDQGHAPQVPNLHFFVAVSVNTQAQCAGVVRAQRRTISRRRRDASRRAADSIHLTASLVVIVFAQLSP